ncbi:MAG: DUF1583 domain-containing protein [Gemmataceae bacterium]|nr:DUF1583 domain-containing protein [Gemmataceae bacterium]
MQDFRTGRGPDAAWKVFGPGAEQVMRPERGGLRIRLDAGRKKLEPVGLSPHFSISGDFDLSIAYEIVAADKPTKGYGVGVNILLQLHSEPAKTAKIAHYLRQGQGNVLFLDYKVGQKEEYEVKSFPTESKKGQLALKRTGSTLFFMAGASGSELKELFQTEAGKEDVQLLRIVANTGGSPSALDVRFEEVRIRAGKLLNAPEASGGDGSWPWLVVGAAVILGAGIGLWWWKRRAA